MSYFDAPGVDADQQYCLSLLDQTPYLKLVATRQQLSDACSALASAMPGVKELQPRFNTLDPAVWVKQHVQQAWKRTGEKCPRSNHPDGKIVKFVRLALKAVGHHREHSGIAQALKRAEAPN